MSSISHTPAQTGPHGLPLISAEDARLLGEVDQSYSPATLAWEDYHRIYGEDTELGDATFDTGGPWVATGADNPRAA